MYRARAEAVSGTRVFANGKWLQCIGNKRVSIGDRIWTDGRCVYGYEQESQQPLIPPPQEDEGIPIMIGTQKGINLYTFEKNKLKLVAQIISENGKRNLYFVNGDQSTLIGEMPNTNKWTKYTLMVNDEKKNCFLYDEGTNYKETFYGRDSLYDENNFWTNTKLIARNISKSGTIFDMVIRYESELFIDIEDGKTHKNVESKSVDILENGVIVKTVDINEIAHNLIDECPDAEPIMSIENFNFYYGSCYESISDAFIENENRWCFWYRLDCKKESGWSPANDPAYGDNAEQEHIEGLHRISYFAMNNLSRRYLILNEGITTVAEHSGRWESNRNEFGFLDGTESPTDLTRNCIDKITFPIQDGYYCTAHNFRDLNEDDDDVISLPDKADVTFYSPKGNELFTGHNMDFPNYFTFNKNKGKYLLGVSHGMYPEDEDAAEFTPGLYQRSGNQWVPLHQAGGWDPSPTIFNLQLRPMKKIRGWQKRLQSIELEQHEI